MPDLLTHFLGAYILGKWVIATKAKRSILYLGAILPDLFSRGPVVLLEFLLKGYPWKLSRFFINFHSPFVVVWISVLISQFFEKDRRKVFFILLSGAGFHYILDSLQRHVEPVYFWFFPFSWERKEIALFWADDSLYAIPVLLAIILLIEGIGYIFSKN